MIRFTLFLGCCLCLATGIAGQTYLHSNYQKIAWTPASTLTIKPTRTATHDQSELRLKHHAGWGAVLDRLQHLHAGALQRTFAGDPGTLGAHSGLWRVRIGTVPTAPGRSIAISEVGPGAKIDIYTLGGATGSTSSAILVWRSVQLPGAMEVLDVELELRAESHLSDSLVTAKILCRRRIPSDRGVMTRYTLEGVDVQVTLTEEKHAAGAASRVYVPIHQSDRLTANNLALPLLGVKPDPESQLWSHPGYQSMQFAGWFQPGYKGAVFLGTEDFRGYRKFFRYYAKPVVGATNAFAWRARYVPEHDADPSDDGFLAPYPVLIHSVRDRTETWWYDVADFYRRLIQAAPSTGNNIVQAHVGTPGSILNPVAASNSVFVVASTHGARDGRIYGQSLDYVRAIQRALGGGRPRSVPAFLQYQEWLNGKSQPPVRQAPIGPCVVPQNPVAGTGTFQAHPSLAPAIANARRDGIGIIVYSYPGLYRLGAGWPLLSARQALWGRDDPMGTKNVRWLRYLGSHQVVLDKSSLSGISRWYVDNVVPGILAGVPGVTGLYLDDLAGAGPRPRYAAKPGFGTVAPPFHGGRVTQEGRIQLLDRTRAKLREMIALDADSVHPDIPIVYSEVAEEYLAGHMDMSSRGHHLYPGQGMLAEADLSRPAARNWQARDLLPPTWNLVYHETAPAHALGMELTLFGFKKLKSSKHWLDQFAYVHGLMLVNGMNPLVFSKGTDSPHADRLFDHRSRTGFGPSVVGVEAVNVATSVRDLLRCFYACRSTRHAGLFLTSGRRERPLVENHGAKLPSGKSEIPHAYSPMTRVWDWLRANPRGASSILVELLPVTSLLSDPRSPLTRGGVWPAGVGPSPLVHHSVWSHRSQKRKLLLVFFNWSHQAARWQGEFDPALYDVPSAYSVKTTDPVTGASTTQRGVSGKSVFVWGAPTPGQVGLSSAGKVPIGRELAARSARIVEIW